MHSIRDPISALDSWLERHFIWQFKDNPNLNHKYVSPALDAYLNLLSWDRSHRDSDAQSCAIRFEDLHLCPEATMRNLAKWLEVPYRSSMLESTLNGRPYVVTGGGVSWVGANPSNAARRSKYLNRFDQLVIFALLQRNFSAWRYPTPAPLKSIWVRLALIIAAAVAPTKMEVTNAKYNASLQAAPAVRARRLLFASMLPLVVLKRRLRFAWLFALQAVIRQFGRRRPLRVL
jgi:hypothetical protein